MMGDSPPPPPPSSVTALTRDVEETPVAGPVGPTARNLSVPPSDGKATLALSLGLLSVTCGGFLAGIPAILVGVLAKQESERRGGQDRALSVGGIVLGMLGTAMSLVALAAVGVYALAYRLPRSTDFASYSPEPPTTATTTTLPRDSAPFERRMGSLAITDLGQPGDGRVLREQLAELERVAVREHKSVLLVTVTKRCAPCRAFERSLADPRMMTAFSTVLLARIDAEEFESELSSMHFDADSVPWFFKLDQRARPVDAISAAEWDETVPGAMAPVFDEFLKGNYRVRKLPPPFTRAL